MSEIGKSSLITRTEDTISKKYNNLIEYQREVNGIKIMQNAHINSIINVRTIDDKLMTITYDKLYPVLSIPKHHDIMMPLLLLGAIILDEIHSKGIVHGDFWLGNLVINEDGKLFMIDFEETHTMVDDEDAFGDILAFLRNLRLSFPVKSKFIDDIIDLISITKRTKVVFMGKEKIRTTTLPKTGLITNFTSYIMN